MESRGYFLPLEGLVQVLLIAVHRFNAAAAAAAATACGQASMSAAAERVQSENYAQDQEQSNGKGCPLSTVRDIFLHSFLLVNTFRMGGSSGFIW